MAQNMTFITAAVDVLGKPEPCWAFLVSHNTGITASAKQCNSQLRCLSCSYGVSVLLQSLPGLPGLNAHHPPVCCHQLFSSDPSPLSPQSSPRCPSPQQMESGSVCPLCPNPTSQALPHLPGACVPTRRCRRSG